MRRPVFLFIIPSNEQKRRKCCIVKLFCLYLQPLLLSEMRLSVTTTRCFITSTATITPSSCWQTSIGPIILQRLIGERCRRQMLQASTAYTSGATTETWCRQTLLSCVSETTNCLWLFGIRVMLQLIRWPYVAATSQRVWGLSILMATRLTNSGLRWEVSSWKAVPPLLVFTFITGIRYISRENRG